MTQFKTMWSSRKGFIANLLLRARGISLEQFLGDFNKMIMIVGHGQPELRKPHAGMGHTKEHYPLVHLGEVVQPLLPNILCIVECHHKRRLCHAEGFWHKQ